ncbi:pre-toxin TG domain-containing protein [Lysinibacillus sp. CNPSo 3705]|uniref:pre-toxin TG domain-containing protein n=1 Tax=Lysinibacillus sp. CNPSo 3705 TaxID=3028148 RepID=UPI0023634357|nr:pre-toxin TG domain-containing protein [Lysinibacillus sp. CNPSo 3705]MDD1504374.1 pre-toxin TG domain-containing protein [Lysinibacillus sp. CNPSo 3705]
MAKKGKSKSIGFFGAIGSLLGCIPAVRNVKKAIGKAFKKKIKKAKNKLKLKNLFKRLKKNFKKKRGKVFTKARKLKNKLSKRKLSKIFKKAVKKAVLAQKKVDKRATTKGGKASKAAVKQVKKYEKAQNLKLVSMGLNCVPIFGNIKALYEMGTGKDLITGQTKQTGKKIIDEAELEKYLKDRQSVSNRNRNSVNAGEPITTLEDLRKVLSAPSTVNPDGLAPYAVIGANIAYALVLEDLVKYGNPNSTFREQNEALLSLLSPFGKAGKAKKGVETLEDLEKGLEAAYDLANKTKKVKEVQHTQKEIEQLEEYLKKIDKGTGKVDLTKTTNPEDFLDEVMKRQGLDELPGRFKEKWVDGDYKYEIRAHEAETQYGKSGSIYRVGRQKPGNGTEYMDSNGKWHHESTLKETHKDGRPNPLFNEEAARDTHIQLNR